MKSGTRQNSDKMNLNRREDRVGYTARLKGSAVGMAVAPHPIHRVGILGAGQMGAGIAAAHVRVGIPCILIDLDAERLQDGLERARHMLDRQVKTGESTSQDVDRMMGRITVSTDRRTLASCDLVIEAIIEDEAAKTETFRKLGDILGDASIVASNTSTIPIGRMASSAPDPGRFAGMHFFHPVDRMELVEIIRGERTDDRTIASLDTLARRLGKVAIVVNDCPGFLRAYSISTFAKRFACSKKESRWT
ncbi:MAG: hypothetical protein ABS79_07490 [Planctomycetes bacterium SCN 63-9]|nr:MAG: hypothetical protein ABS79_07490 [Planctomycetes bacterium SCN 63-9]